MTTALDLAPDQVAECASVFTYRSRQALRSGHEHATISEIARHLATLRGGRYDGEFEAGRRAPGKNYFVPDETLSGETAAALGISDERDLFGGIVPFAFVATKAITHGLPPEASAMPEGWSASLGDRIHDSTHRGFTAFCERA